MNPYRRHFIFPEALCALLLTAILIAGFFALQYTTERAENNMRERALARIALGNAVARAAALKPYNINNLQTLLNDELRHSGMSHAPELRASVAPEQKRFRLRVLREKRILAEVLL